MTTQANMETQINEPDAEQVCGFMRNHPEFFEQHPELLAELRLSHPSGNAVSLIERQVQVLRDQNEDLKSRLLQLIEVARDNDRLNERMHSLTLDLLAAQSPVELLDRLEDHVYEVIGLVGETPEQRGGIVAGRPVIGLVDELRQLMRDYDIEQLIFTSEAASLSLAPLGERWGRRNLRICMLPASFAQPAADPLPESAADLPLIELTPER